MAPRPRITHVQRLAILYLSERGLCFEEIGRAVNCSGDTAARVVRRQRPEGPPIMGHAHGRLTRLVAEQMSLIAELERQLDALRAA